MTSTGTSTGAAAAARLQALEPPNGSFASDNAAGAHPAVMEAIVRANAGHALAYGDDAHTARCEAAFKALFDADVVVRLAFNGTGANVVALATMLASKPGPHRAIACSSWAHVSTDETGAPERVLSTKLIDLPSADGKIRPEQLRDLAHLQGNVHHVQPGIVSITQPTEMGTLYRVEEVTALCDAAHELGLMVHMDGARVANATAALGSSREALRAFTIGAGVDAMSFGLTKTGAIGAEAVVFFDREIETGSDYIRKQVTQLPSKMRYSSAQFNALLHDDLWLELGQHANTLAQSLHAQIIDLPGVEPGDAPAVNSLYPSLPPDIIKPLQDWSYFWDWDQGRNQVRWMTAWDTTPGAVEDFARGVRTLTDR